MRPGSTAGIRRLGVRLLLVAAVGLILTVGVVVGGLAAGYRPIVIQTGSMGETAPPGALVIARPVDADTVAAGDVLVMRPPGGPTVTHRVIEVEQAGSARFAITKGDANEAPDAAPFPLQGDQLVGRWYLDDWGLRLQQGVQPQIALALLGFAIALVAIGQIRRIWRAPHPATAAGPAMAVGESSPLDPRSRRRRRMAWAALPLTLVMIIGAAFALFRDTDDVAANVFGTRECFDPQLGSVQRGEQIHAIDGTMSVPITPVEPTESFVMASVRSDDGDPSDSTVEVRLAGGGTAIELTREAAGAPAAPVVVSWSVVTYTCGISVQRGTATGDGDTRIDVALADAPPERSFALITSRGAATATTFGSQDLLTATIESSTTLAITSGAAIGADRSVAWQVVTFDDPGDIDVQTVTATLSATATTLTLATPVDERTTFLLASATTTASGGADIGARTIRAHLSSSTTIEISRQIGGEPLEVSVQAVTLRDGSTVRHGVVDLAANQATASVVIDPVDPSRSIALSTVAIPGPSAGGSTDMVTDDVVGEASATFEVTDARTVTLTRDARTAAASFGWQVIEWAGPSWWDVDYPFRQRIDVITDTAAAPGGYTVPVTVDHAALVTNGLSLPDGDDLRVLRWNGSNWSELDRILDEGSAFGTATTRLLFRTDDAIDASSTASYWLYFGNETPLPPAEDPAEVFALVENFDSGTLGGFEDRTAGTAWYAADPWTYRRSLTVPAASVASDLTDLALLVQLTDPSLATAAQPDGSDIRFTAGDGTTFVPHQVERWEPATGELTAWVRVASIAAASPTELFLYAGAPDAPDGQSPRAVWSGLDAVWHLAKDPAGSAPLVDDDGPRNLDGTPRGNMTTADQVPGIIGWGLRFDGVDDHVEIPPVPIGASGEFTVSAWLRADTFGGDAAVVDAGTGARAAVSLWLEPVSATVATVRATIDIDGAPVDATGDMVVSGAWHHVGVTWDGVELTVWVDGAPGTPTDAAGALAQTLEPMRLGDRVPGRPGAPFDGILDEVRISQRAQPAAWFGAQVAQAVDPSFVVAGPPETGTWLAQGTWSHRKPIAIDGNQVSGSPDPFAVLVSITDAELATRARSDGADIVFTANDGVTRLDHVVESWNGATGELVAWVRVPGLATGDDTATFAYYGNASARDQQDRIGVFGDDADLVVLPR